MVIITLLQIVLVFFVGIAAVYISSVQVKIADAKLRLESYEKRAAVFENARDLLRKAITHAALETKDIIEFANGRVGAVFLLGKEINDYLDTMQEQAAQLSTFGEAAARCNLDDPHRQGYLDHKYEALEWLEGQYKVLFEKFRPHMSISREMTWLEKRLSKN